MEQFNPQGTFDDGSDDVENDEALDNSGQGEVAADSGSAENSQVNDNAADGEADGQGGSSDSDDQEVLTPNAQKAINRQHYLYREEQRKNEELSRRLAELEKQQQGDVIDKEPVIPPIPDRYDDDYDLRLRERDAAIAKHAQWAEGQRRVQEQRQLQQQEQQKQRQQALIEKAQSFEKRAETLGLRVEDLNNASQVVANYGVSPDLAEYFLSDVNGPTLVTYLANNPTEMQQIVTLPVLQAVAYINNNVLEKAKSLLPKTTNTPDPVKPAGGHSSPDKGDPFIKNAKFE